MTGLSLRAATNPRVTGDQAGVIVRPTNKAEEASGRRRSHASGRIASFRAIVTASTAFRASCRASSILVLIAVVVLASCGDTSTSTRAPAPSSAQAASSSHTDPVTSPRAELVAAYSDALNAMVSKATTAINDGNAAITANDDKALAAALKREKSAREEFLAKAGALTFPARIQTQVNEMLAALRALIDDLDILIYSVSDNLLYNRYVDQKDQDKADMYAAVKLIDAALGVPDTARSPAPSSTSSKP